MLRRMDSDLELLERWRGGDREAGTRLFERHFKPLYRFFRNKVGDDAEDLVQQTFLACVQARDRFRGDASFRTYLFTAARSKLHDHFGKHARKRGAIDFGVTSVIDLGASLPGLLVRDEEQRRLLHALRRLPVDLQIALELHYFEGMHGPELAAVLDVPEGTVRSRLRRARELLRDALTELGASSERADTTMTDIEGWAAELRDRALAPRSG
jgi:RNA polymerase sigma factor (sigma-70 family)